MDTNIYKEEIFLKYPMQALQELVSKPINPRGDSLLVYLSYAASQYDHILLDTCTYSRMENLPRELQTLDVMQAYTRWKSVQKICPYMTTEVGEELALTQGLQNKIEWCQRNLNRHTYDHHGDIQPTWRLEDYQDIERLAYYLEKLVELRQNALSNAKDPQQLLDLDVLDRYEHMITALPIHTKKQPSRTDKKLLACGLAMPGKTLVISADNDIYQLYQELPHPQCDLQMIRNKHIQSMYAA